MEFEAEYLGSSGMFTQFFGPDDDYFSLFQGEQKSHESIANVLVEKFTDYGVTTGPEIDTDFEDSDSLFDNEWMTAKIDLTSGLAEQLDSNFNLLTDDTQIQSTSPLVSVETEMQFSSVITALLGDKSINAEKLDLTKTSSGNIEDSVLEDLGPVSPEQHVPDVDGEQFKAILDSFLASGHIPLDDPIVETTAGNSLAAKRKFFETAPQGPKPKVKTPEQKQRKRLQNRNAATKYRSKKRSEQDTLNAKCVELEGDNVELQKKIESKTQEILYLKNLIIDVFSKKRAGS